MATLTTAVPGLRRVFTWVSYMAFTVSVAPIILFSIWGADRKPPMEVLAWTVVPGVHRGGYAQIDLKVHRDLKRHCSALVYRYFQDLSGRRNYISPQRLSDEDLRQIERITPGESRVSVYIPANADIGPGSVVTTLEYECNPLHRVWPLLVHIEIPVVVTQ